MKSRLDILLVSMGIDEVARIKVGCIPVHDTTVLRAHRIPNRLSRRQPLVWDTSTRPRDTYLQRSCRRISMVLPRVTLCLLYVQGWLFWRRCSSENASCDDRQGWHESFALGSTEVDSMHMDVDSRQGQIFAWKSSYVHVAKKLNTEEEVVCMYLAETHPPCKLFTTSRQPAPRHCIGHLAGGLVRCQQSLVLCPECWDTLTTGPPGTS
jgi:hypothetical protein